MSDVQKQSGVLWMPNLWWPCSLGFCPSQNEWDALMKGCKVIGEGAVYPVLGRSGGTFTSFNPDVGDDFYTFGVITISDDATMKDPSVVTSTLVHESVHAFQYVCRKMGETHPSPEFEAYSIQAIYTFMEREFSRTRWSKSDGKKDKETKANRTAAGKVRTRNGPSVPR
jgi:hypothetical protein